MPRVAAVARKRGSLGSSTDVYVGAAGGRCRPGCPPSLMYRACCGIKAECSVRPPRTVPLSWSSWPSSSRSALRADLVLTPLLQRHMGAAGAGVGQARVWSNDVSLMRVPHEPLLAKRHQFVVADLGVIVGTTLHRHGRRCQVVMGTGCPIPGPPRFSVSPHKSQAPTVGRLLRGRMPTPSTCFGAPRRVGPPPDLRPWLAQSVLSPATGGRTAKAHCPELEAGSG